MGLCVYSSVIMRACVYMSAIAAGSIAEICNADDPILASRVCICVCIRLLVDFVSLISSVNYFV